jgi:pantoate--beta-alanine ligase
MDVVTSLAQWRSRAKAVRASGGHVGLVPTMGALHEGHLSLVRAAKERGDVVFMTIFVNPRQFNDASDLDRYPRTPEADAALALAAGVDVLVTPTTEEMWPNFPAATATTVSVTGVSDDFEGAGRPGHFDGVASVVAKLFAVTGECRAYFGEKDFQQVAVISQMVQDLALDVTVVPCPIVRDETGLALSSRNVRLSPEGLERALALSRAVASVARITALDDGRERLRHALQVEGIDVHYAELVDAKRLTVATPATPHIRALVAASVEGVRLIDNGLVELEEE